MVVGDEVLAGYGGHRGTIVSIHPPSGIQLRYTDGSLSSVSRRGDPLPPLNSTDFEKARIPVEHKITMGIVKDHLQARMLANMAESKGTNIFLDAAEQKKKIWARTLERLRLEEIFCR